MRGPAETNSRRIALDCAHVKLTKQKDKSLAAAFEVRQKTKIKLKNKYM